MTEFCLGWKIDEIQENLVFQTDAEFDLPNLEKYPGIVNQWWKDFFEYLNEYPGIDVWRIPEHMDSWFYDEDYAVGAYLDNEGSGPGEHEWLNSMKDFIDDQKQRGHVLPNPQIHSGVPGLGIHYFEDIIHMTLEKK